jgi:hypothetical protein
MYNTVTGKIILSQNIRWFDWAPYNPISSLPINQDMTYNPLPNLPEPHPLEVDDSNVNEARDLGLREEVFSTKPNSTKFQQNTLPNKGQGGTNKH